MNGQTLLQYATTSDNGDEHTIKAVEFRLCPPELNLRSAVVEVWESSPYDKNLPKVGSMNDLRMGTDTRRLPCATCHNRLDNCYGHPGVIRLAYPIYHPPFMESTSPKMLKLLSCLCFWCSRLLLPDLVPSPSAATATGPDVSAIHESLANVSRSATTMNTRSTTTTTMVKLNQQSMEKVARAVKRRLNCPHCGGYQPIYRRNPTQPLSIETEWSQVQHLITGRAEEERIRQPFTAREALEILTAMEDDDVKRLGYDPKRSHPKWWVLTTLNCPPPPTRPSVCLVEGSRTRGMDEMTKSLKFIINANNEIIKKDYTRIAHERGILFDAKQPHTLINQLTFRDVDVPYDRRMALQNEVGVYLNHKIKGLRAPSTRTTSKQVSIHHKMNRKEGRVRQNCMAKRTDFNARTVIGPDPNVNTHEVGVSRNIALKLTKKEQVNALNFDSLLARVRKGPRRLDGAHSILDGKNEIMLDEHNCKTVRLAIGWWVRRYMNDGDWIVFNRQPSLHRESMMGHQVRIVPSKTFGVNPSVMPPYNADCDGDEMNLQYPQDVMATADVAVLMNVERHIVTPQNSRPCISLVQDGRAGSFLLTRRDVFLTRAEVCQLLAQTEFVPPGRRHLELVPPAILKPRELWTGKQLYEMLLPADLRFRRRVRDAPSDENLALFDLDERMVLFSDGQFLCGNLCRDTVGDTAGGVVHHLVMNYSNRAAMDFLSDALRVVCMWLGWFGLTVSRGDCTVRDNALLERVRDFHRQVVDSSVRVQELGFRAPLESEIAMRESAMRDAWYRSARDERKGSEARSARDERKGSEAKRSARDEKEEASADNSGLSASEKEEEGNGAKKKRKLSWLDPDRDGFEMEIEGAGDEEEGEEDDKDARKRLRSREWEPPLWPTLAKIPGPERYVTEDRTIDAMKKIFDYVPLIDCRYVFSHYRRDKNGIMVMSDSGSKGSPINLTQLTLGVGCQTLGGKLITSTSSSRNLACEKHSPLAVHPSYRGLILEPYSQGLDPVGFFLHCISGREGLIDTAVKTSETGYVQRRLTKCMEELQVTFEGQVVDGEGEVIEMVSGGDGIDLSRMQRVNVRYLNWTDTEIAQRLCLPVGETREMCRLKHRLLRSRFLSPIALSVNNSADPLKRQYQLEVPVHAAQEFDYWLAGERHMQSVQENEEENGDECKRRYWEAMCALIAQIRRRPGRTTGLRSLRSTDAQEYVILSELHSQRVVVEHGVRSEEAWSRLHRRILDKYFRALLESGEMVGPTAATSIGEKTTQSTLDNHRNVGGSNSKGRNVTLGVPRFKELLDVSKKTKKGSDTVFLREPWSLSERGARLAATLMQAVWLHTLVRADIDDSPTFTLDRETMDALHPWERAYWRWMDEIELPLKTRDPAQYRERVFIRLRLDGVRLKELALQASMVAGAVREWAGPEVILHVGSTRNDSKRPCLWIFLRYPEETGGPLGEQLICRRLQNVLKQKICLQGITGDYGYIRRTVVRKVPIDRFDGTDGHGVLRTDMRWIVETERERTKETKYKGSEFETILHLPCVDPYRTFCNDPLEMASVIGTYSANLVMRHEFQTAISADSVNRRHFMLQCNLMTHWGWPEAMSRNGLKKNHGSVLSRVSFEKMMEVLTHAATYNVQNNVAKGDVSSRIFLGMLAGIGSGNIDVLVPDSYADAARHRMILPVDMSSAGPPLGSATESNGGGLIDTGRHMLAWINRMGTVDDGDDGGKNDGHDKNDENDRNGRNAGGGGGGNANVRLLFTEEEFEQLDAGVE